jgi:hypothetical protein
VKQRRAPGVVVDDEQIPRVRHRCDRRNVGHLKGLRAGRLDQHGAGVRLEQLFDAGADQGIEKGGLDAVAGEHAVAEIARGPVDIVGHQQMVAGFQHRQQGGGDGGQSRGHQPYAGAFRTFQRHQHVLERPGGRRAVSAIGELAAVGVQVPGGRVQHGGTVENWRIDKTVLGFAVAACRDQSGFGFLRVGRSVARKTHAFWPPKTFCRSRNQSREVCRTGGSEPGILVTGHRSRPSTP